VENKVQQKPYQVLAWIATALLIVAAAMASFVPTIDMFFGLPGMIHHYAFSSASILWVVVGILWQERSLIVLNSTLTIIYLGGVVFV
jgi:hypothetical protein